MVLPHVPHSRRLHAVAHRASSSGFTLIELLAVIGIMVFITGVVLANNNKFGGKVLLQNLVYDIALSIRQAQVYGISVERFSAGVYAPAYGVHLQANSNPSAQDTYVLFADVLSPRNGMYDCPTPGVSCELVLANTLLANYHVASLCTTPSGGSETCGLSSLDVSFQRPNPDAFIRANGLPTLYGSARIVVTSPQGNSQSVIVESNGQIAVQ